MTDKGSLFTGEWKALITAGKIIGIFVGAWAISIIISAIIWVFAYYFSPLVDSKKDNISVLEEYFSIKKLSNNYTLVDWEGAKYGDMEVLLEDKERKMKFLVYVLREMPVSNMEVIFSSKPGEVKRWMGAKERYFGGVYHREISNCSYDFVASYYKKYFFRDFSRKGVIIKDKQESKDRSRYRLISGYIGQLGFNGVLIWTYRKIENTLNETDTEFPSIGIVFIEREEEPQKLYVVTMELGEREENLGVIKDFTKSYFGIEIKE